MADEILVFDETELLLVGGSVDLLVETVQLTGDLLEVAQQGPPGPPGRDGAEISLVADPLAYYILAKA